MNSLKRLFFEQTLRHWHFEDLVKESQRSRERVSYFLKELRKEDVVKRIKPRREMPYYVAHRENPKFRTEKQLFGLTRLEQSGLFEHLASCPGIETAIIFGSFARGDWNKSSDVDLFIYGHDEDFDKAAFELKLQRNIQVFSFQQPKRMQEELEPAVIPNIIKGFNIKGTIEPFGVSINA